MFNLLYQPVKCHIFGQITHRPYVNIDYCCFDHDINIKTRAYLGIWDLRPRGRIVERPRVKTLLNEN